jgi:rRNA metabolism SBDS family protein
MADVTLVRYSFEGEKFEIMVKPDPALDFKMGKKKDISAVLVSDEIYTDSGKGTRPSSEKLLKAFNTEDQTEIAQIILEKGDLNLTTDQRRKMVEDKKKQIVTFIAKTYVDPKTHLPHPPLRIEQAMKDGRVSVDPQKNVDEQVKDVVEKLRSIIALKSESLQLEIVIPAQFASQSYAVLKSVGSLKKEEWQNNGSLKAILEIPAAARPNVIDRLGSTGPFRPEQNVILDGNKIVSTTIGISEIYDDSVRVIPLTGKYIPKINDLVIGKVISHTSLSWELDINSCYVGFLPAQDVFGRDFSAHADELSSKLKSGDLVAARIANFDRTRDPLVTISDRDLGAIDSGELVKISPSKVPRLIGKRGSMIQMIEMATNAAVTIGQNGWVVVSCETPEGLLKAKTAIEMINEKAHVANLTDQVKEMLEIKDDEK